MGVSVGGLEAGVGGTHRSPASPLSERTLGISRRG